MSEPASEAPPLDLHRYRRVRRYFLRLALHLLWWDLILARPGLRRLRRPALPRWQALARRYRLLAIDLGGVLIKLGQYLSTRVDVLPREVIHELAGLQDEVPAERFEDIVATLEAELGAPLAERFQKLDPEPLGAASLAQVHGAVLLDGAPVVVKVLRPRIETLVRTDLAAIALAVSWLEHLDFVRRRVDLDALIGEFRETTLAELDLVNEGKNAERFAENFADTEWIKVPEVHWPTTSRRVLTLENVGFLKIGDDAALARAGIPRPLLARRLYAAYMEQIFVHHFVHADPHPGNLFVRPLPLPGEDPAALGPGMPVPDAAERPFEVVFVDFGMVAEVPARLWATLRELVIGFATRDAGRVVRAAYAAGILLPGADLEQIEDALSTVLDRFWGIEMGRLNDVAKAQAAELWREFGHLLLDTPVQVQSDMLFTGRALGILGGLAMQLDPNFDPWSATLPFARRLASEDSEDGGSGWWGQVLEEVRQAVVLPSEIGRLTRRLASGRLTLRSSLAPDAKRRLDRIERAASRTALATAGSGLLIAGSVLYGLGTSPLVGVSMMGLAAATYFVAWWR